MKKRAFSKKSLIKKGAPLPGNPKWKFKDAALTKTAANKKRDVLMQRDTSLSTKLINVPRQYLIYGQRDPRLSPKMPKLSPKMPKLR